MIDGNSKLCTGCGACVATCPKQCISFIRNEEGFNIPVIDESACIQCGKCETVCCAVETEVHGVADESQAAVAAITKDDKVWEESTSGGAFSEICKAVQQLAGDKQIVFCGAAYEGIQVKHFCVSNIEDIGIFRKSKYVQSNINGCFNQIKCVLDKGGYAVFSGTPCQVYGLREFLKRPYDNLFCIDLVCHGVGSPGVFEKSIAEAETAHGKKIASYTFRKKSAGIFPENRYTSGYTFEDGTQKKVTYDSYNRLFLSQVILRSSCSTNCSFRNQNRQGDFTIADFNEKMVALPELKDGRHYSTIVFNNKKAHELRTYLEEYMDVYNTSLEHICKYNPLFCRNTEGSENREKFFDSYKRGATIYELATQYGAVPPRGVRTLINLVPYRLKRVIYKLLGKI